MDSTVPGRPLRRHRRKRDWQDHPRPGVAGEDPLHPVLGERDDEVLEVLADLRAHDCDMLTLGQYLQPSRHHLRVARFVPPPEFAALGRRARALGFASVSSGPLVRSSYHADLQAAGSDVA